MRPLELQIQGFTCFADRVTIDFRRMDVFVISGPTGAGKTTIIDAICYALYGKVPRGTDTSGLVSRNRDEMFVDLTFEAGGKRYRVHRGIALVRKTKRDGGEQVTRGVSPVQLERFENGAWEPIEGRVRGIDEEVERAIGLDFASFTRCVLLPQGQFQEFLSGDKTERRGILISLLGMEIYERVMAAANRAAADLKAEAAGYDRQLAEDFADATEEHLASIRAQISASKPLLAQAEQERDALAEALRLADAVLAARARATEKQAQHNEQLQAIAREEHLAQDGASRLEALRAQFSRAEQDLQAITYDRAKHSALGVARAQAQRVDQLAAAVADLERAAADTARLEAANAAAEEATRRQSEADAAIREAEAALQAARRADMAASVREGLKPGDPCPVCGGVVGKLPKAAKGTSQAAERALQAARAAEKKRADGVTAAARDAVRERERHERAMADVATRRDELATAAAALRDAVPPGIDSTLAVIDAALQSMEAEAQRLDETSARVAALRAERDELQELMAGHTAKIADMRGTARALDEESQAATREADASKKTLIAIAGEWRWERALSQIDNGKDPRPTLKEQQRRRQDECDGLHRQIATLEASETRIEREITRAAEIRSKSETIRKRAQIYQELGTLLRANNFQDFVLSEAMEVLAESATEHLKTLHRRFAITVKKGEFLVIDEWQAGQERPAKTLSGGETFVASLALALALSDRLPELQSATRGSLDSLFLDEGFGTLDAETLETVISALEGLRSEERMVGMITHVRELAERIESRIEVRNAREGSTVVVTGAHR